MSLTQATANIGKPDNAYALVALLSKDTSRQFSLLLGKLCAELGDIVWAMPEDALHITLCEIIQPKNYAEDKQALYDLHSSEYESRPGEILAKHNPIKVTFSAIEVSSQAIIIRGTDDGSFEEIRKELVNKLPLPSETKMPPDIIHSTIARFTKEVPLEDVENIARKYSLNLVEDITSFKLINNLTLPLLSYKVIRSYPLSK